MGGPIVSDVPAACDAVADIANSGDFRQPSPSISIEHMADSFLWLEAIFHCIGTALMSEDAASKAPMIKSLVDCGEWLAGDRFVRLMEGEDHGCH